MRNRPRSDPEEPSAKRSGYTETSAPFVRGVSRNASR